MDPHKSVLIRLIRVPKVSVPSKNTKPPISYACFPTSEKEAQFRVVL